jgi:glycosyltransferase involved in cell wall biosynthesis
MPDADTSVNTGADENPGDRPGDQTAPAATSAASDEDTHPGILLYGMYPMTGPANRAPTVRIALMAEALSRRTRTEEITGGRFARVGKAARWVFTGGPRRVKAVYVETPTTSSMPTDMALLVLMRLLRRPVGIYFRDAYPLYRDVHPRTRRRQVLGDLAWRITTPLLKRVASVRYAPSAGLAAALKLSRPVLLPPGTDPTLPDLGIGEPDVVGAIVQMAPRSGLDTLVAAMKIVRERRPAARLRVLAQSVDAELAAALPDWVEVVSAARSELPGLLKPARVCVLPVPINDYTNLAVAVRLLEYLGFGKPIVATDTTETRAILAASGAGTATPDTAAGLAGGILPILADESVARRMADGARRYACSPTSTWDDRAGTVLATLGLSGSAAVEPSGGKGGR